jgi:hypothetical protein
MPAKSKAQQQMMGIAEHDPSKLYKRNQGVMSMSKGQMHDFAATSSKSLPAYKKTPRRGQKRGSSKGPKARSSSLRGYKVT